MDEETRYHWINVRHREVRELAESLPVPLNWQGDHVWMAVAERMDLFGEAHFWEDH